MEQLKHTLPTLTGKEKNIGFAYLVFQLFFLPLLLQLLSSVFFFSINETLINFIYFSLNFCSVIAIFSRFMKKSLLRAYRFPREVFANAAIGFLVYWLCIIVMSILTQILFPDFVNINDSQIVSILGDHPVLMFLGTVIFAPVAEEALHRGLVFGALFQKNIPLAYGLSALLFAAIHVMQYVGLYTPGYLLLAFVQYLPAGIILAWGYQRSGCILTPMLIHAANNAIAISMTR
ncbi:MAG: CPBP family intramembrane metalloprotease [Oscillospiraceae bacterium]|nr:CPBP family intramembrane metalloprotease [Oscillospiraceae bacterium]